jgi:EAL domain-containing protein (putative c-di-GMP-specific phosphodiesterase class I)
MDEIISINNNVNNDVVYQLLPKIPEGKGTLIINLIIEKLCNKFIFFLNKNNIQYELTEKTIKINEISIEKFITKLIDENSVFNDIEMDAINVLFLKESEKLDFNTFSKIQPLSKMYRLIKAKDLVYILNNKKLRTYFQPIIDIKRNEIYAYECLSRGIKEDGSIMGSHMIFRTAFKSDLLYYLDREARETALMSSINNNVKKKIFINFVPSSIYNPKTSLKDTLDWVEKLGHKPSNIVFEIIETEDIDDAKYLKNLLNEYRKQGFKIALDDIGSGYSSLSILAEIKPDYIKVDMDIIRNIHKDKFKQSIFRGLTLICKENNIKVLAEGVETKDELDFCIDNGADYIQGFYYAKPTLIPLEKI